MNQSAVLGDTLLLQNLKGSDAGVYKCSAVNILGQAYAVGHLIVNGEFFFLHLLLTIILFQGFTLRTIQDER